MIPHVYLSPFSCYCSSKVFLLSLIIRPRSHTVWRVISLSNLGSHRCEGLYLVKDPTWAICHYLRQIRNHIWGVQRHHHIWPWVILKGQNHMPLRFRSLISRKGAEFSTSLLNINTQETIYDEANGTDTFCPWVTLSGQSQGHSHFEASYLVKEASWVNMNLYGNYLSGVKLYCQIWPWVTLIGQSQEHVYFEWYKICSMCIYLLVI